MKRKIIKGLVVIVSTVLLFIVSCKKDKPVPSLNMGYNYFPNNVGHYVIYDVDSVIVNHYLINPVVKYNYQIKEVIDSVYTDASGRPTQRIVRYKKSNSNNSQWVLEKIWSGNLTTNNVLRKEDNITYVKLVFPVTLNATWDGNGFNNLGEQNYRYTSINAPLTIGGTYFDSTLTVLQDSTLDYLDHKFYQEIYATGVGRISKKIINLTDTAIRPWLASPNLQITDALLQLLYSGSVVYTETYVSSGN